MKRLINFIFTIILFQTICYGSGLTAVSSSLEYNMENATTASKEIQKVYDAFCAGR